MEGAIADYGAVVELEGAPADQVAKALFNRGVAKGEQGDAEGAIADYEEGIRVSPQAKGFLAGNLRRNFEFRTEEELRRLFESVIEEVLIEDSKDVAGDDADAAPLHVQILSTLASRVDRKRWLLAWDLISGIGALADAESLSFYAAAASVLRDDDRRALDPLPQQEREFAEEVIERILAKK